jgi:hypothetical protein
VLVLSLLSSLSSSGDREGEEEGGGVMTTNFTHSKKAKVYGSIQDSLPMDLSLASPKSQRCLQLFKTSGVSLYRVGKEWSHAVNPFCGCAALVLCFHSHHRPPVSAAAQISVDSPTIHKCMVDLRQSSWTFAVRVDVVIRRLLLLASLLSMGSLIGRRKGFK